jgi:Mce-associated membrane protein
MADDPADSGEELKEPAEVKEGEAAEKAEADQAEDGAGSEPTATETPEADEAEKAQAEDQAEGTSTTTAMTHVRKAMIAGLVTVLALAGLTGWLGSRAYQSHQTERERDIFLDAGRQGAINLTTIDWEHADADVQRVLDTATGTFYDEFEQRSQPFREVVKQAKSKSVGTVNEAALESMSGGGGKVLAAVTVRSSNAASPQQPPQAFRMRITVQKVGDQAKVSNVEYFQ